MVCFDWWRIHKQRHLQMGGMGKGVAQRGRCWFTCQQGKWCLPMHFWSKYWLGWGGRGTMMVTLTCTNSTNTLLLTSSLSLGTSPSSIPSICMILSSRTPMSSMWGTSEVSECVSVCVIYFLFMSLLL